MFTSLKIQSTLCRVIPLVMIATPGLARGGCGEEYMKRVPQRLLSLDRTIQLDDKISFAGAATAMTGALWNAGRNFQGKQSNRVATHLLKAGVAVAAAFWVKSGVHSAQLGNAYRREESKTQEYFDIAALLTPMNGVNDYEVIRHARGQITPQEREKIRASVEFMGSPEVVIGTAIQQLDDERVFCSLGDRGDQLMNMSGVKIAIVLRMKQLIAALPDPSHSGDLPDSAVTARTEPGLSTASLPGELDDAAPCCQSAASTAE